MRKKSKNYINNADLYNELLKYHEAKQRGENPRLNDYIGKAIMLIAQKMATRPNFNGYTWLDEMIADGIESGVKAADKFDPTRFNNPFGYFSRAIWNSYLQRISAEKQQIVIKHENKRRLNLYDEHLQQYDEVTETIVGNYNAKRKKK